MSLAEKLGNKIFAIETNLEHIRHCLSVSTIDQQSYTEVHKTIDSIQESLEQLKTIKKQYCDEEPYVAHPDTMSDAERAWMEDKADGFLDSDLPHP